MYGHYTAPGYLRQPTLDGYGEQWTPARIVYNGLGEPVGAFPALAALLPLAAKAIGAIAPVAAKAAGAIMPAIQSAMPMLAKQGLPSLLNVLPSGGATQIPAPPQLMPRLAPGLPAFSPTPSLVSPAVLVQPLATPQAGNKTRRRRRHYVRILRDRGTGTVRAVRPIIPMAPGAPTITASQVTVRPPPPPATESSGGMAGYGYSGNPYGEFHYAGPPAGLYGWGGY